MKVIDASRGNQPGVIQTPLPQSLLDHSNSFLISLSINLSFHMAARSFILPKAQFYTLPEPSVTLLHCPVSFATAIWPPLMFPCLPPLLPLLPNQTQWLLVLHPLHILPCPLSLLILFLKIYVPDLDFLSGLKWHSVSSMGPTCLDPLSQE